MLLKSFDAKSLGKEFLTGTVLPPPAPAVAPAMVCTRPQGSAPRRGAGGAQSPMGTGRDGDTVTFLAPSASAFFRAASKSSFCPMLAWKGGKKSGLSLKGDHKTQCKPSPAWGIMHGMVEPVLARLEATQDRQEGGPPPRQHTSGPYLPLLSPVTLPRCTVLISGGSFAGRDRLCHTGLAAQQSSTQAGRWLTSESRVTTMARHTPGPPSST